MVQVDFPSILDALGDHGQGIELSCHVLEAERWVGSIFIGYQAPAQAWNMASQRIPKTYAKRLQLPGLPLGQELLVQFVWFMQK